MKTVIVQTVVAIVLLIAAVWQAVQGDWNPAIFLALMWVGWSNNTSHAFAIRQRAGLK